MKLIIISMIGVFVVGIIIGVAGLYSYNELFGDKPYSGAVILPIEDSTGVNSGAQMRDTTLALSDIKDKPLKSTILKGKPKVKEDKDLQDTLQTSEIPSLKPERLARRDYGSFYNNPDLLYMLDWEVTYYPPPADTAFTWRHKVYLLGEIETSTDSLQLPETKESITVITEPGQATVKVPFARVYADMGIGRAGADWKFGIGASATIRDYWKVGVMGFPDGWLATAGLRLGR